MAASYLCESRSNNADGERRLGIRALSVVAGLRRPRLDDLVADRAALEAREDERRAVAVVRRRHAAPRRPRERQAVRLDHAVAAQLRPVRIARGQRRGGKKGKEEKATLFV